MLQSEFLQAKEEWLLCTFLIGQTDSKMEYSHDIAHGMKKLRLQAQKRLQVTLLSDEKGSTKIKVKLPNPRFIFHNKIPKSGSTTLANIVHTLEERNRFKLRHFHPCINERKSKMLKIGIWFCYTIDLNIFCHFITR